MKSWTDLLNTALLGTDRKAADVHLLPVELQPSCEQLVSEDNTREENLLRMSALLLNYRRCGTKPEPEPLLELAACPPDEKEICSPAAATLLQDILGSESLTLLKLWLNRCIAHHRLIPHGLIPTMLDFGSGQKELQQAISTCCGKRGEWLADLNPAWKYSRSADPEVIWETGTTEQRRYVLTQVRKENPATAIKWLQQTWPSEDANIKQQFLDILNVNATATDLQFIEGLSNEKSKKVRDAALGLLKQIPGSSIVSSHEQILRELAVYKKEKGLLGLGTKRTLEFKSLADPDGLKKSGIDILSSSKDLSDDQYIIYQLISAVPPGFWQTIIQETPEEIVELFGKNPVTKKYIPALVVATAKFRDPTWAKVFDGSSGPVYIDIIHLLPDAQQVSLATTLFSKHGEQMLAIANNLEQEWTIELAKKVVSFGSTGPWQYNRAYYSNIIDKIPVAIIPVLDSLTPDNAPAAWADMLTHIRKLLTLKQAITTIFND